MISLRWLVVREPVKLNTFFLFLFKNKKQNKDKKKTHLTWKSLVNLCQYFIEHIPQDKKEESVLFVCLGVFVWGFFVDFF